MAVSFQILDRGARLRIEPSGRTCRVLDYLDAGSQGAIYHAELDGRACALKWYHPYVAADADLRARIVRAVERGAPDFRFLWPMAIAADPGGGFGYVMSLRPAEYIKLARLFAQRPQERISLPLRDRVALGMEIASGFFSLHARGLCYQDINFGAIFLSPEKLAILICDNDNVDVDGALATVSGTPKFMAPEIVRGEAGPSADCDLHSLAVLLFYLIFYCHPLEGRAAAQRAVFSPDDEIAVFGSAPLFIFDEADDGNGPMPGHHDAQAKLWAALPPTLRTLFSRAFGPGLKSPRARVIETEWIDGLQTLRDGCVTCPDCSFETPYFGSVSRVCGWCAAPLQTELTMRIGRRAMLLSPGARVHAAALGLAKSGALDGVIGRVELVNGARALRNCSDLVWSVAGAATTATIAPGEMAALQPGDAISFTDVCLGRIAPLSP